MLKKMRIPLLAASIVLSACVQAVPVSSPTPETIDTPIRTSTPTHAITDQISPTPTPRSTDTRITPTATKAVSLPGPLIHTGSGPIYDTVINIPVGETGILYRGAGVVDMQPVGPNGIVVTPDGVIIIGDVFGNRLMRYDLEGNRLADIDLTPMDILNISDMVGIGEALYILEISFKTQPERYRVNALSTDGELINQFDLPKGFHFEDGLFGLAIGYPSEGTAQVLVDMVEEGEHVYYSLPESSQTKLSRLAALPVFGKSLQQQYAGEGELAVLSLGTQEFESQMSAGGSIFLLSAREDGSLYLHREDLVGWDPIITDITIHYVTPDGVVAGVARYPLMDWYFHIWRFLTVGPDGNVYGLITREQSVDVLRLNFYTQLEPILPEAAPPVINSLPTSTAMESNFDCSALLQIDADSVQAQEVVQSLIANYKNDYPTEY